VQNVAPLSKKAQQHITGLLMANSIVYHAVNPNTGYFSLPQLMKMFTRESEILLPVNFHFHLARYIRAF
jgi:hypothetical protein